VPSVAIHEPASNCLPVQAVDGREQIGGALDERDQGADGEGDAALGAPR
jgi:hypothetical protein